MNAGLLHITIKKIRHQKNQRPFQPERSQHNQRMHRVSRKQSAKNVRHKPRKRLMQQINAVTDHPHPPDMPRQIAPPEYTRFISLTGILRPREISNHIGRKQGNRQKTQPIQRFDKEKHHRKHRPHP